MKVSIVGFGSVGQAVYHIFKDKENIKIYDKNIKHCNDPLAILCSDFVFVCLPTPNDHEGDQDVTSFIEFFKFIKEKQKTEEFKFWNPVFIIKSTILFKNISPFLDDFKIVMNPEFLNKNSAYLDSKNQKLVILGGHIDLLNKVETLYRKETCISAEFEYLSVKEAIDFKYIRNIYGAYKVLFWNWVQEQTGDARKLTELYCKLPQGEMSQVAADGKLGYGGACFVKDVRAKHNDSPHELTEYLERYNERLRSCDDTRSKRPDFLKG